MSHLRPFCDVILYGNHSEGDVVDFGFTFAERPIERVGQDGYTFTNWIEEPITGMLLTKPELKIIETNGSSERWWFNEAAGYWYTAYPPGFPPNRTFMKWACADPSVSYELIGKFEIETKEGFVWEVGLLPSVDPQTAPEIELTWGDDTAKLVLKKHECPSFWIKSEETYYKIADVPLLLKHAWKDVETEFIWIVPFMGGVLFGTDGVNFEYIRTFEGIQVAKGRPAVYGNGGVAVFGVHEIELQIATLISGPIERDAQPVSEATVKLHGWLPTNDDVQGVTSQDVVDIDDLTFRYEIGVAPYKEMLGLSKVDVYYDPQIVTTEPESVTINYVESLDEQIPEDPSQETCTIRLDNPANAYGGLFKRFQKVRWDFGWQAKNGTTSVEARNTGLIVGTNNTRDDQGNESMEISCRSVLERVRGSSVIYANDYEGWNIAEALEDYLKRQGVPASQISIYNWTDEFPITKGKTLWQPNFEDEGYKFLDDVVTYLLGGWVYTQRDGVIRIEPYPELEEVSFVGAYDLYTSQLASMSKLQPEEAISEVRNIVTVMGLTPAGFPIAQSLRDYGSLYNPTADNYCGGVAKALYIQSEALCTQEIVNATCARCYERFRKMRKAAEFTTSARDGSSSIFVANPIRLIHRDGSVDRLVVRSISSRMAFGEFQQTVYSHYVEESN